MTSAIAGWAGGLVAGLAMLPLVWKWQLGMRRCVVGLGALAVVGGAAALAIGAKQKARETALRRADGVSGEVGER